MPGGTGVSPVSSPAMRRCHRAREPALHVRHDHYTRIRAKKLRAVYLVRPVASHAGVDRLADRGLGGHLPREIRRRESVNAWLARPQPALCRSGDRQVDAPAEAAAGGMLTLA